VTCAETRFESETLGGVEHHQAGDERRELGVASVAKFIGVGIEKEIADVAVGNLGSLVDELPTFVLDPGPAHTRSL
jgi:hypothetical protein